MHIRNGGGVQLESSEERGIKDRKEKSHKSDLLFSRGEDGNFESVSDPIKSEKVCIIQEQQQKDSHCGQKGEDKSEKSGYSKDNGYGKGKKWKEKNKLCENKGGQEP